MKTVVGFFATKARAEQVKSVLEESGFASHDVSVMDESKEGYAGNYGDEPVHESLGERVKHFFGVVGDQDETGHQAYANGVTRGGAIVSVRTADDQAGDASEILYQYGATDVEQDLAAPGGRDLTGTSGAMASATSGATYGAGSRTGEERFANGQQVIPVVEEDLAVGKREVHRGGVRVYAHAVDTPVSTDVRLHEERVLIERHAVNRAATVADYGNEQKVVEMTAMGEEAVVGKRSRVVEEVTIGTVGSDRTEQIHDFVRHTQVNVEEIAAQDNRSTDEMRKA